MGRGHLDTPTKSALREAIFHRRDGETKAQVFRRFNIYRRTAYRILNEPPKRKSRRYANSGLPETRGRPKKLSESDVQQLVHFVENNGFDNRTIYYAALPAAAGLDVKYSGKTVRLTLKAHGFRFYKARQKQHLSEKAKARKVEYARHILEEYPKKED